MNTNVPEYTITLAFIRLTILDSLNGQGLDELAQLFCPLAQTALQILLDADDEITYQRTRKVVARLARMNAADHARIRYALLKFSYRSLEALLDENTPRTL